jgi:hypothetical protein
MGLWQSAGIIRNWFARHRPRGAAVPFETPALRMARVCDDERDGLVAILRDFANNGTAYIVPWKSLPLVIPMTEHDQALHGAVWENKATTPEQVRAVVSKLALSGALGHEARARESERARAEQGRLADVELVLILHLLESCGADLATFLAEPTWWHERKAKSTVMATASAVGVKRQDMYRRIVEFATLLQSIGLPASDGVTQAGWLRVLHAEIEDFGQNLTPATRSQELEIGMHLAAIAATANRIAHLSGIVLDMLDYAVLDIGGTLRRWDSELPVLRRTVERLSVMLDEWPELMKLTRDALRDPTDAATAHLRPLHAMLPRLPDPVVSDTDQAPDGHAVSRVLCTRLSAIRSMLFSSKQHGGISL